MFYPLTAIQLHSHQEFKSNFVLFFIFKIVYFFYDQMSQRYAAYIYSYY